MDGLTLNVLWFLLAEMLLLMTVMHRNPNIFSHTTEMNLHGKCFGLTSIPVILSKWPAVALNVSTTPDKCLTLSSSVHVSFLYSGHTCLTKVNILPWGRNKNIEKTNCNLSPVIKWAVTTDFLTPFCGHQKKPQLLQPRLTSKKQKNVSNFNFPYHVP